MEMSFIKLIFTPINKL